MDITQETFGKLYRPVGALVIYQYARRYNNDMYVEYMNINTDGHPVNAHPLTVKEAQGLAKVLHTEKEKRLAFLRPKGLLPTNVLHLDASGYGRVIWYTKAMPRELFFADRLEIPCGKARVPAMIWMASVKNLYVYALHTKSRPRLNMPLYYAPFFNVSRNGGVCMGTVDVQVKQATSLEEFMQLWENYFFHSYFSHILGDYNPIKENLVLLWKRLVQTGEVFPENVLKKTENTLKNLIP